MPCSHSVREQNYLRLKGDGFEPASWLPLPTDREQCPGKLRPLAEIGTRLMALDALVTWVALPPESAASEHILEYVECNSLLDMLTDDEQETMQLSRQDAEEQHIDTIGWRLENMWPLAWVLGFGLTPDHRGGEVPPEVSKEIIYEFLPGLDASLDALLAKATPRPEEAVCELEDLFYLAHNAARGAQLGESTVPDAFNAIIDAGAIHERRHALTWCLSPGIAWPDTDLST